MEIILLEQIEKLGQMGDVVKVKDGYARNYLLPQKKALRATKENMERFEHQRAELETRNVERRSDAETTAPRLEGLSVVMLRQASDSAQLYGSVNARDVAQALSEAGFDVGRRQIELGATIKSLGIHPVSIRLHPEVTVTINVNVARSEEEAEAQARAGGAIGPADEDDEELAVERFFEEEVVAEAEKDIAAAEVEGREDGEAPAGAAGEGEVRANAEAQSESPGRAQDADEQP